MEPTTTEASITLHLRPTCTATDNVTITQRLPAQAGPHFFSFPLNQQLDDSTGQSYCLVLESSPATAGGEIRLPLSEGDLYPHGQLKVVQPLPKEKPPKNAPVDQADKPYKIFLPLISNTVRENYSSSADIGFILHYNGLAWPTAQVFLERLTANKPYFLGSVGYYVGLMVVYVVLLAGLAVVARRTIRQ